MEPVYQIGTSSIHGLGLFARIAISGGQIILEYSGERISKAESILRCSEGNPFIFYLDEQFDLDGNVESNPARFLNHSCSPNCTVERVEGRLVVVAQRPIAAGEELTFNYGYDLSYYREYPCNCGADACVGYVLAEEFHETAKRAGLNRALQRDGSGCFKGIELRGCGFPFRGGFGQCFGHADEFAVDFHGAASLLIGLWFLQLGGEFDLLGFEGGNLFFKPMHQLLLLFAFVGSDLALLGFDSFLRFGLGSLNH